MVEDTSVTNDRAEAETDAGVEVDTGGDPETAAEREGPAEVEEPAGGVEPAAADEGETSAVEATTGPGATGAETAVEVPVEAVEGLEVDMVRANCQIKQQGYKCESTSDQHSRPTKRAHSCLVFWFLSRRQGKGAAVMKCML